MFGRNKDAAASLPANLKRAVKATNTNVPKAVNQAAKRGKPKP